MVEQILYFSLGALLAALLGLLFLPFFWRRAVRLTTQRLVDRLPISAAEIVAAQDRLRAEHAMSMRETERKAESAADAATRDRVESARARASELGHLADIADLRSQVAMLEAESLKARGERDRSGEEAATAFVALQKARALAGQAAKDLEAERQDAAAARSATEQAKMETAEREAEVAALKAKFALLSLDESAPDTARRLGGTPRMPHVDRPFAEAEPIGPEVDAAALAALRKRLDEVADQIVKAAEAKPDAPEAPEQTPAPPPRPKLRKPKRAVGGEAGAPS